MGAVCAGEGEARPASGGGVPGGGLSGSRRGGGGARDGCVWRVVTTHVSSVPRRIEKSEMRTSALEGGGGGEGVLGG